MARAASAQHGFYDEQMETTITRMTALLEPLLIVMMVGLTGLIIVAVVLPLFNLTTAL